MRKVLIGFAVVLVGFVLAGAAGVYFWDASREDEIAEGVTVNGIDLGGASAAEARARLRASTLTAAGDPVVVERGDDTYTLTAKQARLAVNVDAMVDAAVDAFAAKIEKRVNRPAREASIEPTATDLRRVKSKTGVKLMIRALRSDIEKALGDPGADRTIEARTRKVEPEVSTRDLAKKYSTYITVDRDNFKTYLFKDLKLSKTYRIAVGAAGHDTPTGLYDVNDKAVDPTWYVPDAEWAGDLAGKEIPSDDPRNPLKARWLGVANGVGFHGTDDRDSIGSNAFHGCLRMRVEDVKDLYDRVPVGTPVYIA